jgi:hypothetical protein
METVVSNFDAASGYVKWLRDFRDQQKWANITLGGHYNASEPTDGFGHGRVGGVAPFSVAQETDTAWGIAVWTVPQFMAEWYHDERLIIQMYACARWNMEHWIAVAASTGDWFEYDKHQDFGNTDTPAEKYLSGKTQYFYTLALEHTARFAVHAGNVADAKRYTDLASAARALYMRRLYLNSTGCFSNCTYVNQIFGLSMPSVREDDMSAAAAKMAWAKALEAFGPNATNKKKSTRFGGGIVTLKLVWPLFQRFGEVALGLKTLLHTDQSPSLGFMTTQQPGTTLHEAYNMNKAYTGQWVGSFNHIMMGSPGRWFYTLFAGIDRKPPSSARYGLRTWQQLVLAPPREPELWKYMSWCNATLQTPCGRVLVNWKVVICNRTRFGTRACQVAETNMEELVYLMDVVVPVNAYASVMIPTVIAASSVTIFESGSIVFSKGGYRRGVAGIENAQVGTDGLSVQLDVGSGNYSFAVFA